MSTELKDQPIPSSVRLERGQIETVELNDGTTARVKVRFLPARHLNRFIDLRDIGQEAELLCYVLERDVSTDPTRSDWRPLEGATPTDEADRKDPTAFRAAERDQALAFIDDLTDESHARLVEIADWLNFTRAVSQAERQIALGNALLPLKKRQAATMMAPIEESLRSLTSSLITQLTSAAAKK